MAFNVTRPINYWWYDETVTAAIGAAIQQVGHGRLRLRPYLSRDGEPKLDWAVYPSGMTILGSSSSSTGIPGGNESNVCPPNC